MIYIIMFGSILVSLILGALAFWFGFKNLSSTPFPQVLIYILILILGIVCFAFAIHLILQTTASTIEASNKIIADDIPVENKNDALFSLKKLIDIDVPKEGPFDPGKRTYQEGYESFSTLISKTFPPQEVTYAEIKNSLTVRVFKSPEKTTQFFVQFPNRTLHYFNGRLADYPTSEALEIPSMKVLKASALKESFLASSKLEHEDRTLNMFDYIQLDDSGQFLIKDRIMDGSTELAWFRAEDKTYTRLQFLTFHELDDKGPLNGIKKPNFFRIDSESFFVSYEHQRLNYAKRMDLSVGHSANRFSDLFLVSPQHPKGIHVARFSLKEGMVSGVAKMPEGGYLIKLADSRSRNMPVFNYWKLDF